MTASGKCIIGEDIQDLVSLGYLQQTEGTAGRNVKYELNFEPQKIV